jgi:hypothetical protein
MATLPEGFNVAVGMVLPFEMVVSSGAARGGQSRALRSEPLDVGGRVSSLNRERAHCDQAGGDETLDGARAGHGQGTGGGCTR